MKIDAGGAQKIFAGTRARISRRARGLLAPERCIEAVESALKIPLDEGLALERKNFDELVQSDQSKAQRHLFFAERLAQKIPGVAANTPVREIRTAAVIPPSTAISSTSLSA